jgi:hypothetical protein
MFSGALLLEFYVKLLLGAREHGDTMPPCQKMTNPVISTVTGIEQINFFSI